MTKLLLCQLGLAAATLFSSDAVAKEIPVYITWNGIRPTAAFISTPGGPQQLSANGSTFHGTISVVGAAPERRTVTLVYGTFNQAFYILVAPVLPSVTMWVRHTKQQQSCTGPSIAQAAAVSLDELTAVERFVDANELVNIKGNDRCQKDLAPAAVLAEIKQNKQMMLFRPMYLISPELMQQYKEAFDQNRADARKELASFEKLNDVSEVSELERLKLDAANNYDYTLATEVNDYMLQRISSSHDVAMLYASEGITSDTLKIEAVHYTNPGPTTPIGSPIPAYERGERGKR